MNSIPGNGAVFLNKMVIFNFAPGSIAIEPLYFNAIYKMILGL